MPNEEDVRIVETVCWEERAIYILQTTRGKVFSRVEICAGLYEATENTAEYILRPNADSGVSKEMENGSEE